MMTKKENIKIETFDVRNDFYVDIIDNPEKESYEAFIYEKDCGIKDFMFGCPKTQNTYEEFLELIECSLTDYKITYLEEREKDEIRFWEEYEQRKKEEEEHINKIVEEKVKEILKEKEN